MFVLLLSARSYSSPQQLQGPVIAPRGPIT